MYLLKKVTRGRKKINPATSTFVSHDDIHSFVLRMGTAVCRFEKFSKMYGFEMTFKNQANF